MAKFCSAARAHEVLGGKWTLLLVRELLSGSRRFNDIGRGIPRISRTMLSERLQALALAGVVTRVDAAQGPEYVLTEAGRELSGLLAQLGIWGQRWLPRQAVDENLDVEPLLIDMQRRVRFAAIPTEPLVIGFDIEGSQPRFLLLSACEASLCAHNPGFPEPVRVTAPLAALVAWWRGDVAFVEAQRMGMTLSGPRALTRSFPQWFDRYIFAATGPAGADRLSKRARRANAPVKMRSRGFASCASRPRHSQQGARIGTVRLTGKCAFSRQLAIARTRLARRSVPQEMQAERAPASPNSPWSGFRTP